MAASGHTNCDSCGSSDAVTHYDNGSKCFSCGEFKTSNKKSSHVRQSDPAHEVGELILEDLTPAAYAFLRTKGVSKQLADRYDLKLNAYNGRIHIASYLRNNRLGYQERAWLPGHGDIKCLQPKGLHPGIWAGNLNKEPLIVLVEDAFSAMIVSQVLPAIALCGTSLDSEGKKLNLLHSVSSRYIIWLDGDKAGRIAVPSLVKKLRMIGDVVKVIQTPKDPKEYSLEYIMRILS